MLRPGRESVVALLGTAGTAATAEAMTGVTAVGIGAVAMARAVETMEPIWLVGKKVGKSVGTPVETPEGKPDGTPRGTPVGKPVGKTWGIAVAKRAFERRGSKVRRYIVICEWVFEGECNGKSLGCRLII